MQAAKAAFPKDFRYAGDPRSGKGSPSNSYETCAAIFSRDANGAPDLIAAGYSGEPDGIAMLRYNSSTARIVDLVKDHHLWLAGGPCDASVVNLSDPALPDSLLAKTVEIFFEGQDWSFTWDRKRLQNITALYYQFGPN
jgi:hypothetical protein